MVRHASAWAGVPSDDHSAFEIETLSGVAKSKDKQFRELVHALAVISQHSHIEVDIGEGEKDTGAKSLRGRMDALVEAVFPALDNEGGYAPLERRDPSELWLKKYIPKLEDRYRDFPDAVKAFDFILKIVEHSEEHSQRNIKQIFRDNLTANQMDALKGMYTSPFRKNVSVCVKRSDIANAQEKLALERVKAKLPGTPAIS